MEKDFSQCVLAKLIYTKESGVFQLICETVTKTDDCNNVIETDFTQETITIGRNDL